MVKVVSSIPEATLELYEKVVATNPEIEVEGTLTPYTTVNGNMSSFVTQGGHMALRLAEVEREAFLVKYKTRLVMHHGRVMQEYVEVPPGLLKKTRELKKHFEASLAYVATLKPKPTTRKKAAKKAAKKPAAKKPAAKKPAAKKPVAKKAPAKKAASSKKTTKKVAAKKATGKKP